VPMVGCVATGGEVAGAVVVARADRGGGGGADKLVERLEPARVQRGDEGGEVQLRAQRKVEEAELSEQVEIDTACECRWRPKGIVRVS